MNAADPTKMRYYVIKYLSEKYTLQKYQTTYGQVSKASELAVKAEYLSIIKAKNISTGYSTEKIRISSFQPAHV